jgi:hypothetical protein
VCFKPLKDDNTPALGVNFRFGKQKAGWRKRVINTPVLTNTEQASMRIERKKLAAVAQVADPSSPSFEKELDNQGIKARDLHLGQAKRPGKINPLTQLMKNLVKPLKSGGSKPNKALPQRTVYKGQGRFTDETGKVLKSSSIPHEVRRIALKPIQAADEDGEPNSTRRAWLEDTVSLIRNRQAIQSHNPILVVVAAHSAAAMPRVPQFQPVTDATQKKFTDERVSEAVTALRLDPRIPRYNTVLRTHPNDKKRFVLNLDFNKRSIDKSEKPAVHRAMVLVYANSTAYNHWADNYRFLRNSGHCPRIDAAGNSIPVEVQNQWSEYCKFGRKLRDPKDRAVKKQLHDELVSAGVTVDPYEPDTKESIAKQRTREGTEPNPGPIESQLAVVAIVGYMWMLLDGRSSSYVHPGKMTTWLVVILGNWLRSLVRFEIGDLANKMLSFGMTACLLAASQTADEMDKQFLGLENASFSIGVLWIIDAYRLLQALFVYIVQPHDNIFLDFMIINTALCAYLKFMGHNFHYVEKGLHLEAVFGTYCTEGVIMTVLLIAATIGALTKSHQRWVGAQVIIGTLMTVFIYTQTEYQSVIGDYPIRALLWWLNIMVIMGYTSLVQGALLLREGIEPNPGPKSSGKKNAKKQQQVKTQVPAGSAQAQVAAQRERECKVPEYEELVDHLVEEGMSKSDIVFKFEEMMSMALLKNDIPGRDDLRHVLVHKVKRLTNPPEEIEENPNDGTPFEADEMFVDERVFTVLGDDRMLPLPAMFDNLVDQLFSQSQIAPALSKDDEVLYLSMVNLMTAHGVKHLTRYTAVEMRTHKPDHSDHRSDVTKDNCKMLTDSQKGDFKLSKETFKKMNDSTSHPRWENELTQYDYDKCWLSFYGMMLLLALVQQLLFYDIYVTWAHTIVLIGAMVWFKPWAAGSLLCCYRMRVVNPLQVCDTKVNYAFVDQSSYNFIDFNKVTDRFIRQAMVRTSSVNKIQVSMLEAHAAYLVLWSRSAKVMADEGMLMSSF